MHVVILLTTKVFQGGFRL